MSAFIRFTVLFLVIKVDCKTFHLTDNTSSNDFDVQDGEEVQLKFNLLPLKFKSLEARASNGLKICQFGDTCGENIRGFECSAYSSKCSLTFPKFPANYAGLWDIHAIYDDDDESTTTLYFTINRIELVENYQDELAVMKDGEFITILLNEDENPNQLGCILYRRNSDKTYDMTQNNVMSEIWPIGGCGARMTVREVREGNWWLEEIIGYTKRRQLFEIHTRDKNHRALGALNKGYILQFEREWYESSSTVLEIETSSKSIYCEAIRPDGFIVPSKTSKCIFEIDEVTNADNGVWLIHWASAEKMTMHQYRIKVTVGDLPNVTLEIEYTRKSNALLVSSESPSWFHVEQCRAKRPNDIVTSIFEFSHGCNIVIADPSEKDIGDWEVSMFDGGNIINVLVNIDRSDEPDEEFNSSSWEEDRVWVSVHKGKYVKQGNAFTVKCATRTQLDYCWIKNPEGSLFSSKEGKESKRFETNLENCGLESKVCGCTALIENANKNYTGNWTCQMGLKDKKGQMNSTIPIIITDSYLITKIQTIDSPHAKNVVILECRPHAELSHKIIGTCQWFDPNRNSITTANLSKYTVMKNEKSCDLQLNGLEETDIGMWTCNVSLGTSSEEYSSTIELSQKKNLSGIWHHPLMDKLGIENDMSSITIVGMITFFTFTTGGIIYFFII